MNEGFGIKVAQPGFDVNSAGDPNLYFSSNWPILKIDPKLTGTNVPLPSGHNSSITITHNLGYPPFIMLWSANNGFWPTYITSINSQTITFTNNSQNSGSNPSDLLTYYIFRLPINQNFHAQNIQANPVIPGSAPPAAGFKVAKPGKDASKSKDLRDFTINSTAKSLMVHQVFVGPVTPSGNINTLVYTPDLPYNPVYFAYYAVDNINYIPLAAASQVTPKVSYGSIANTIIINSGAVTTGTGSIIILLDPYQATNQAVVTL